MGKDKEKQLIILAVLLLATGVLVFFSTTSKRTATKPVNLRTSMETVSGYPPAHSIPLNAATTSTLELDDYTQSSYEKNGKVLSLFIGYYFSLEKVSAAHSPLICFPAQGWSISQPTKRQLAVNQHTIHYSELLAGIGEHQEVVMYWFQAHEKTTPVVQLNKLYATLNKLTGKSEEHAFVRVSVPVDKSGPDKARKQGEDFIAAFYPSFLTYVNSMP